MTAIDALLAYQKTTEGLGRIAGRLGWDQETMMPTASFQDRSEEWAAFEAVMHARKTSSELGDLLAGAEEQTATPVQARLISLIRQAYDRNTKVPADLAISLAKTTSLAHRKWVEARKDEDVPAFLPILEQVVDLRIQEGQAISEGTDLSPYDALLQDYEPGMRAVEVEAIFDELRGPLVELRQQVMSATIDVPQIVGTFDEARQMQFTQMIAEVFGYDMSRGRIDKAVHPFSSGSGNDVRITTRTSITNPLDCIYSTIHEVGHATYEQNIDQAYNFTPAGEGASMGVHESQSRIYENQLGRSEAFTSWMFGKMRDAFGDFGIQTERDFYRAVNAVSNGYIRTEADELQYNLHVMLRFNLEQRLISGDLGVADLEAAWNETFLSDFGFAVDRPSNGVLQDVHWSEGLFGYFPTYSLGNVFAGCLFEKINAELPQFEASMASGDLTGPLAWLKDNVQVYGKSKQGADVIKDAIGKSPSSAPLVAYLTRKFSDLYEL